MSRQQLVVIGSSYAGVHLAAAARDGGFDGRIVMVGEEPHLPYQRPPLSKAFLQGKVGEDGLALKGEGFYQDKGIERLASCRAIALDASARHVTLADGSRLDYDWLALTTGARCRRLDVPGSGLARVFELRTLDDARRIDAAAGPAAHACVIGGGFIGLEVAATLSQRGVRVTVVEAAAQLMGRAVSRSMADFFVRLHENRGVRVLRRSTVTALHGDAAERVAAVELSDGTRIACDLVVVGIGVVPNVELARQAGIECSGAILVDTLGRTSLPQVLAAGDCAVFPSPYAAGSSPVRLESIQAANDLARAAGSLVAGQPRACDAVPWFWSDQYDVKLQMAGLASPGDEEVLRGDVEGRRFTRFHLRGGRIAAAHSVNRPAEHMLSRKLIAAGCRATHSQLGDDAFDLKALLAAAPSACAAS